MKLSLSHSLSLPTLSVILLDPDPGCLACKRETERQEGEGVAVVLVRRKKQRSNVQKWGQKKRRKRGAKYRSGDRRTRRRRRRERKWGLCFSFFSFLSFFFFPFVQDKGFFYPKHFRFCEFGTR
jgi:hypothetical protein